MVGQGTWQMARGAPQRDRRSRRCAPGSRAASRTSTPPRCTAAARRGAGRRGDPGHRRDEVCSSSARCCRSNASRAGTLRAVRAEPAAPGHRPPRRLPPALARQHPARRDARRARGAGRPGQDPRARRVELRRRRSRGGARAAARAPIACNQVLYHLGERHIDARAGSVLREARHRGRRLQPVRHGRFPSPSSARRARARRRRGPPRRDAPSGRARVPRPRGAAVHDPEGVDRRARRGERRRAAPRARPPHDLAEIDAAFPVRAGTRAADYLAHEPVLGRPAQAADAVRGRQAVHGVAALHAVAGRVRADAHRLQRDQ